MGLQWGKTRKHIVFKALKRMARFFCPVHYVRGVENVQKGSAAVFVCSHIGSYAPIVMELFFPFSFRPWVTYQVVTKKLCRKYLEQDFVKKELKWKRPFSGWLATAIEPLCIRVLRSAEAVPVYKGKKKIRETFEQSVAALKDGSNLAIFLTDLNQGSTKLMGGLQSGFIHLAKLYHRDTCKELLFYPIFVDKEKRNITICHPVAFVSENDFRAERKRIISYLQNAIEKIVSEK